MNNWLILENGTLHHKLKNIYHIYCNRVLFLATCDKLIFIKPFHRSPDFFHPPPIRWYIISFTPPFNLQFTISRNNDDPLYTAWCEILCHFMGSISRITQYPTRSFITDVVHCLNILICLLDNCLLHMCLLDICLLDIGLLHICLLDICLLDICLLGIVSLILV